MRTPCFKGCELALPLWLEIGETLSTEFGFEFFYGREPLRLKFAAIGGFKNFSLIDFFLALSFMKTELTVTEDVLPEA